MALADSHKEAVLASHPLLRHLKPEDLRQLAMTAQIVRHPRHATLFQKGDPGNSMMAITRGRVKLCTFSNDGREVVLNIVGQGGLFGEIAILDGNPRSADAVTLEETDLLVLERGASAAIPHQQSGSVVTPAGGAVPAPAADQRGS